MRLADWSPEVAELRVIADRLAYVASAVIGTAGGKAPRLPDLPRPEVAADRVKRRNRLLKHQQLVTQLIPTPPEEV